MQHISVTKQVFFRRNWTITYLSTTPGKPKSIYITSVDIFSKSINPWKSQSQ